MIVIFVRGLIPTEEKNEVDKEAPAAEQQTKQSVQDTQVLSPSPPHTSPTEQVIIQDATKTTPQNINPLTTKDLK